MKKALTIIVTSIINRWGCAAPKRGASAVPQPRRSISFHFLNDGSVRLEDDRHSRHQLRVIERQNMLSGR
jgi:hypothetical protein